MSEVEVLQAIRSRRTIRAFKPAPVPKAILQEIIGAPYPLSGSERGNETSNWSHHQALAKGTFSPCPP